MRDIERYARNYIENDFENNVQVKYRRKKVKEILNKHAAKNILEIGCGMEPIFKHIDMNLVDKVTVVEPAKEFAENALQSAKEMGLAGKVNVVSEAFEICYKSLSSTYDMILCSGLLHEVENPGQLLECIGVICNENTVVHINVPNAYSLHRLLAFEMNLITDIHEFSYNNRRFQQYTVFDIQILCALVIEKGFIILDKGSYFCKPFAQDQMLKMQQLNILDERILDGLDSLVKYMPEYGSEIYVTMKARCV